MAFSEPEKVQIRRWMGANKFYIYSQQRLESAISTVETGLDDAGETETFIKDTLLVRLEATFQQLVSLESKLMALDADEVKVDPVRAVAGLQKIGRIYSSQLATALGFIDGPISDAWSAVGPEANQFLSSPAVR